MISDRQVVLMRQKLIEGKTQKAAASGMSERSVRTWRKGPLPSENKVRRRPSVPGMNRVSTNSARMIPCHHLKRHLGRSVCDSKSLMPGYCGTVDEPNESGREVLYVKIRSGDLRG